MARVLHPSGLAVSLAVLILSAGLGSCGTAMIDTLPAAVGGEPAGLPARPAASTYRYPAVHDMPPTRAAVPLDDNQQLRMEKELEGVRDKQNALGAADAGPNVAPPDAPKPAAVPAAKKKASAAKSGQTSGAKPNP